MSRYFLGLDLSSSDKLSLANWREKYLRGLTDKPVPAENFHITLSFLGALNAPQIEKICLQFEDYQFSSVTTKPLEIGTFAKPQILYLGADLTDSLKELAHKCLAINSLLGLKKHHDLYKPHITLTRKHKDAFPIAAPLPKLDLQFDQFHLFESIPSGEKGHSPHYPIRQSWYLRPNIN